MCLYAVHTSTSTDGTSPRSVPTALPPCTPSAGATLVPRFSFSPPAVRVSCFPVYLDTRRVFAAALPRSTFSSLANSRQHRLHRPGGLPSAGRLPLCRQCCCCCAAERKEKRGSEIEEDAVLPLHEPEKKSRGETTTKVRQGMKRRVGSVLSSG